ncbi:MAG TPA: type III secretion system chaperone [Ramlibacter sp.]|jgi:hypothetical protein|nr:type III secretion system chaperone [Ramlibacter sp.]
MQPSEQFPLILSEALQVLNLPPASAHEGASAWHVAFDGVQSLDIEYDNAMRRIVVSGYLCEVAEESRFEMYEILLQYNFVWSETGGVRMALDASTKQAVIMFEAAVAELDTSRLASLLSNMADAQRVWTEILRGPLAVVRS